MSKVNIDIDNLLLKYESGSSAASIAKEYGVSVWSIITRLNKSGIHIRSNKEQNEKRLNLTANQESFLVDIVDGLLLGDGWIDIKGLLRIDQSHKRYCLLEDISTKLAIIGVHSRILPISPKKKIIAGREINSGGGSLLYTPAYIEIQRQRNRWYPEGIKRIPKDINISPLVLSYWFAGDGTYNSNGILSFCTNGFIKADTEFLINKIKEIGIEANLSKTNREGQYTIGIYKISEVLKLKNIIQSILPECCQYKLRFVKPSTSFVRKLTDEQVLEIINSTKKQKDLANIFRVSQSAISSIKTRKTFKYLIAK